MGATGDGPCQGVDAGKQPSLRNGVDVSKMNRLSIHPFLRDHPILKWVVS